MLNNKQNIYLFLLSILVLCSRVPFLFAGYGSEEDSWGIALAAHNTMATGILEVSRFPGHPFQEIIYSLLWGIGPFGFNLLSALFSTLAFIYLYFILKEYQIQLPLLGAFTFAFIPIIYVSSTYTIDYMWTCALVLMSYYYLLKNKILLCGFLLGLAIACRITSGAMLLPYFLILWQANEKKVFIKKSALVTFTSLLIGIIFFIPVYRVYGSEFFMYYDQFPYPPLTKVIYKYSIGAWGLIGLLTIGVAKIILIVRKYKSPHIGSQKIPKEHLIAWLLISALYTISYFRLPQKAAYVIPIIPFAILAMGTFLKKNEYILACIGLILSSFLFGINLTDAARGSESSSAAIKFSVSGQEIFIDPITGPVLSDFSKRKSKMNYTLQIIKATKNINQKTTIISGWWYNEIKTELLNQNENPFVKFEDYLDKPRIDNYLKNGYSIYFLPEQNLYNDQMFGMNITDSIAKPFVDRPSRF
jgi:hypothetical protein